MGVVRFMENQRIRSMKEPKRILQEMGERIQQCSQQGHPYNHDIITPYQGKGIGEVAVQCSNCKKVYDRPATSDKIASYGRIFDLEFVV